MAYTAHGNHIPGSDPQDSPPPFGLKCGGVGECDVCSKDAAKWMMVNYALSVRETPYLLRYFSTEGLKGELLDIGMSFWTTASRIHNALPDGYQKELVLLELLKARDVAIETAREIIP